MLTATLLTVVAGPAHAGDDCSRSPFPPFAKTICGSITNKTDEYVFACTTAPGDIRRWRKASDCPAGRGYKVKPHTSSSSGRRVDLDAFYVPGNHTFRGKVRCSRRWKNSNGPYTHGWYKFGNDCIVTVSAIRHT